MTNAIEAAIETEEQREAENEEVYVYVKRKNSKFKRPSRSLAVDYASICEYFAELGVHVDEKKLAIIEEKIIKALLTGRTVLLKNVALEGVLYRNKFFRIVVRKNKALRRKEKNIIVKNAE